MNKLLHNNQISMYVLGVERHITTSEIQFPDTVVSGAWGNGKKSEFFVFSLSIL